MDTDVVPMVHIRRNKNGTEYEDYCQVQDGLEFLRQKHNFTVCELSGTHVEDNLAEFPFPTKENGFALSNKASCETMCNAVIGVTPKHPALKTVQNVAMENSFKHLAKFEYNTTAAGKKYSTWIIIMA